MQILKAHSGCQMPREASTLNALLQKSQETPPSPGQEEALYASMAKSITLVFRSDHECEKHMGTRTAGLFNEEPELKDLSEKVDALFKECSELELQLKLKAEEYNRLSQERWEKSIKTFGLNVQERFYRIDNQKRIVQQIDLKCEDCQGIKLLRDARQELTRVLIGIEAEVRKEDVTVEPPKEEKADGGTEATADPGPGAGEKSDEQPAGAPDGASGQGGTAS
jgi:hypothetical protein